MKFFTPELFVQLNSEDEDVVDQAEKQWGAAREGYLEHFKGIEKRLPKALVKLCKTVSLHDSRIERRHPTWTIRETDDRGEHSWTVISLKHENADFDLFYIDPIEPARLIRPIKSPIFREENVIWLNDEVDRIEEGVYSHEILFSNGVVLLVKFRGFKYAEAPIVSDRLNLETESTEHRAIATG